MMGKKDLDTLMWIRGVCKGIAEIAQTLSMKFAKYAETKSKEDLEAVKRELNTLKGLLDFIGKEVEKEQA